jgi:hypothetical protein
LTVKTSGSRGVYNKFHAHFYTNKVPRVVLQFLWTSTHLGGKGPNVPHELGMDAQPGTVGPAGAAAPGPCHVFGPSQVLPHVHNLDEQD